MFSPLPETVMDYFPITKLLAINLPRPQKTLIK